MGTVHQGHFAKVPWLFALEMLQNATGPEQGRDAEQTRLLAVGFPTI